MRRISSASRHQTPVLKASIAAGADTGTDRLPAIFILNVVYAWMAKKSQQRARLYGCRVSVGAPKPQRKGDFPASFAPSLCRAFSNVRKRTRRSRQCIIGAELPKNQIGVLERHLDFASLDLRRFMVRIPRQK